MPSRRLTAIPRFPLVGAGTLIAALVSLTILAGGCSDSERPSTTDESTGAAPFAGTIKPGEGTFVLQDLGEPVPGQTPVRVALLGRNLQVDEAAENVSIDVAILNEGSTPLYPPAMIWLSDLVPPGVAVLNADLVPVTIRDSPLYGFDYSALLGGWALAPHDTSGAKTWSFHVPGLTAFSFRARAEFGLVPDHAAISGLVFLDRDRNGTLDPGDPPFPNGRVVVLQPDGSSVVAPVGQEGRYAVPAAQTGLYRLTYEPLIRCRCEVLFTTPNPLTVLLPPGPDGRPVGYPNADFGAYVKQTVDSIPPVVLAPAPLDSLRGDPYMFRGAVISGDVIALDVGFSGCGPDHPFVLYWVPGPEASPVLRSIDLVLAYDDLGELCPAFWQKEIRFSLAPISASPVTWPITVRFHDYNGEVHTYFWGMDYRR
jgi:hypothetical protein